MPECRRRRAGGRGRRLAAGPTRAARSDRWQVRWLDQPAVEQLDDPVGDVEHDGVVVRTTAVTPSARTTDRRRSMIRRPVSEAHCPVGSSARSSLGGWRATARSRPAAAHRRSARGAGAGRARRARPGPAASATRSSRARGSARTSRSGTSTFSAAVRIGISPKVWNTNAMVRRRTSAAPASSSAETSIPSTVTVPAVGRSRPPSRLRSVVLPLPDRPRTASSSPRSTCRSTPCSAWTVAPR